MNNNVTTLYSINLSFEEIKLPPFQEILVIGKNSPHGKIGLSSSFELLIPNGFDICDNLDCENVEAVFVSKRILSKIPKDKLIILLEEKVFPYIFEGELIKVDLKVKINYNEIETTF
ncbi:MAG: hypothetical protein KAJ19_24815 [Gammaproteobacteria bacterium]|nr:hypothetical protein [Bacteroidales bacterium]MCK5644044.1 hypothetical protein [Gammaproteobacteria bacterium]